jgi:hypothetical protein
LCTKAEEVKSIELDKLVSLLNSAVATIPDNRDDRLENRLTLLTDSDTFDEPRVRSDISNYIAANSFVKNDS